MIATRIHLGDITDDALERILATIRAEQRRDTLSWYRVEEASVGRDDHPCNPSHNWTIVESAE